LYEILKIHSKLQKDFVDIAAHELRTPITPILITASNIKADSEKRNDNGDEDGEDNDDIRIKKDDFEIIFRNAKRLKQLTDIFLDVAKIESGILKIEPERFNLNDEILKIIQDYSRNVNADEDKSKRPVKLYYQQPSDGSIFIVADKGRINQVVLNLLDNAIKFTKEGSITVTSEKKDGHVIVGVKDTGTGIDPEVLPRLFTKFATKSGKGTGLGLFISKSIVEAHGGRIWVDNSYTDGTAIQFSLPC
jgi:signal transduction histidine kinase